MWKDLITPTAIAWLMWWLLPVDAGIQQYNIHMKDFMLGWSMAITISLGLMWSKGTDKLW
jgi:hypothetical protein